MFFTARLSSSLLAVSLFVACTETPGTARPPAAQPAAGSNGSTEVGGDQDAHGCTPGAGYSWCAKEKDCVRPWELASSKNLGEGKDAFDRYCGN